MTRNSPSPDKELRDRLEAIRLTQDNQQTSQDPHTRGSHEPDPTRQLQFFDLPYEVRRNIYSKVCSRHLSYQDTERYGLTKHIGHFVPLHVTHPSRHSDFLSMLSVSKRFSRELHPHVLRHCVEYPDKPPMKLGFGEQPNDGLLSRWFMTPRPPPKLNDNTMEYARCLRVDSVHTHRGVFQFQESRPLGHYDTLRAHARSVPFESLLVVARSIHNLEELHIQNLRSYPLIDPIDGFPESLKNDELRATVLSLQELPGLQRLVVGASGLEKPQHVSGPGWIYQGPPEDRLSSEWFCFVTTRISQPAEGVSS